MIAQLYVTLGFLQWYLLTWAIELNAHLRIQPAMQLSLSQR